jgi:hypothetical protein
MRIYDFRFTIFAYSQLPTTNSCQLSALSSQLSALSSLLSALCQSAYLLIC